VSRGRVGVRGGGPTLPTALGRTTVQGRGDDAQDDVEEKDGAAAAEPRRPGRTVRRRRSPGGWGRSGRKPPTFRGPTAADRWRGVGRGHRRSSGGRRRRRIPWGRGRGAPRKAAVGEDDGGGGGGHDNDDGGGSGTKKWLSAGGGGSLLLYIDTPLVPSHVMNRDKRGIFCHGW
jgi:hypothetical protein